MANKKIKEMNKEELQEYLTERYRKQNKAASDKYDRTTATFPIGTKERIAKTGKSLNEFISAAVLKALDEAEEKPEQNDQRGVPSEAVTEDLPWNNL